jgi:hypothetical protein
MMTHELANFKFIDSYLVAYKFNTSMSFFQTFHVGGKYVSPVVTLKSKQYRNS